MMCQNCSGLQSYDEVLKRNHYHVFGIFTPGLPIKNEGNKIRHATEIALACFLSPIFESSDLLDNFNWTKIFFMRETFVSMIADEFIKQTNKQTNKSSVLANTMVRRFIDQRIKKILF